MTWLIDMVRVAVSKPSSAYKYDSPEILSAHLISALYLRNPFLKTELNEIILANAFGTGGNMARYASLLANVPVSIPASTIDFQCAGGLKAAEMAHAYIKSGLKSCIIAGGMESKSLSPEKYYHKNDARRINNEPFVQADFSPFKSISLAESAEALVNKYAVSKLEMQHWKIQSEQKLALAYKNNHIQGNIYSFNDLQKDYNRANTLESLQKLQTLNIIDRTTAASFADAAALILFADDVTVGKFSLKPIAKIIDALSIGVNADISPEGAILAAEALMGRNKTIKPDYYQISESFATIPLSFAKKLKVEIDKINPFGGEMAYGHPYGASGAIGFMSLVQALKANNLKTGLVSYPAAGGVACAVLLEII